MQEPVEFYVNIIRKMVSDNKYVPPVNINPREVGNIPNFLKAKELVKKSLLNNSLGYPTEEQLDRLVYQADLGGQEMAWDRLWEEVKR